MAIPQFITYGTGGTLNLDLNFIPTTATISIYTDGNAAIVSDASCTLSYIDTTLASATVRNATYITVASGTYMANGTRISIVDDREDCLIKSVSDTVVYLRRPLILAHASGAGVEGGRVSYSVSSDDADTKFWRGRAVWTIDSVKYVTTVECGDYPLRRQATLNDVWAAHTKAHQVLDDEIDLEDALNIAHEDILTAIATKDIARIFTSSGQEFNRAVAFAFWRNYYMSQASDDGQLLFDRFQNLMMQEIDKIVSIIPRDADQDGKIEAGEHFQPSARRIRLG